jgi:signal transduction histidine kinase
VLGRLGFVGRVSAILLLALLALWVLGAGLSYVTRSPVVALPDALPLPHQMAAIVDLLESSDKERQQTVLSAASSDTLHVELADELPEADPDMRRVKAIEWIVGRYVGALGPREVFASIELASGVSSGRVDPGWWRLARQRLRVAVALRTGGYAVFETHGELSRRLFGLPPGFWVGALGALVGMAALFAVWHEARPLKELSRSVSRFSKEGQPNRVALRGAPELRRLIEEVNRMQKRIATLLQGRTVLLGAVSHDLNTYITRLRFRVEMIDDPDQRLRAVRDLDQMTALIKDALAVARGAPAQKRMSDVDIGELFDAISADDQKIRLFIPAGELLLEGDPVALPRLFNNLIDNAVRYGGGTVTVRIDAERAHMRITIDDEGPGIPTGERELVFEPFYRREVSRNRETGGSGLGLTIAKQIVDLHGGSIELADAPSCGLRVVVELPIHRSGPQAAT